MLYLGRGKYSSEGKENWFVAFIQLEEERVLIGSVLDPQSEIPLNNVFGRVGVESILGTNKLKNTLDLFQYEGLTGKVFCYLEAPFDPSPELVAELDGDYSGKLSDYPIAMEKIESNENTVRMKLTSYTQNQTNPEPLRRDQPLAEGAD